MTQTSNRLWFIDAARSIAIIMMLQGHFISLTFEDYDVMRGAISTHGTSGSMLFDVWFQFRGFTAPLFFSITGLIFVYLLTGPNAQPVWKQKRVRRGIKRAFTIIIWGYILQLNYKNLAYYMAGKVTGRFYAFHVLHCIGIGILIIIMIYFLHKYIKSIPLALILALLGIAAFTLHPLVKSMGENYFPSAAHEVIQNIFHGPHSIFPLTPWLGYVLLGGAIGAYVRSIGDKIKEKWFPLKFVLKGVLICFAFKGIFTFVDYAFEPEIAFRRSVWFFYRFAEILLLLALLMYVERIVKKRTTWFILMGQNTLTIYILHVIALYGAVIGIGLKTYYEDKLSTSETILSAVAFILFFALLSKVQPTVVGAVKSIPKRLLKKRQKDD
ncbi:MAG: putative membrane protein [Flavobacteriaceae bacterium]